MDHRIHQMQPHQLLPKVTKPNHPTKPDGKSFQTYLNEAREDSLTISKHAQKRLSDRNIQINDHQWLAIQTKMDEAKAKGVTDSLVVLDEALLVVSTKNNTVITAMNRQEANDQIFTNINGTILLND